MDKVYKLGLDIGSTTIKVVLLDGEKIIHSDYQRHHSDVSGLLNDLFEDLNKKFPGISVDVVITGSGGLSVANWLGFKFTQEVMAETKAIKTYHPETDVIIELGGEDAKITYMHPVLEQRMNGTCAGGTGSFIDQMASLLQTDADGLNNFAKDYRSLYTIASRCGVFAKSDLQPLINEGAAKEDLAASIYQSVVNQTISGLACGRPIKGNVTFLGGPLFFNSELRNAFERTLEGKVDSFWMPEEAQIYVALGAALSADGKNPIALSDLLVKLKNREGFVPDIIRIDPIFTSEEDKKAFDERHKKDQIPVIDFKDQHGGLFLGIDAGSTTTKAVVMNNKGELCYTYYASNKGNPVMSAVNIMKDIYSKMPEDCYIAHSCVTGYGENIIRAALNVDIGEIETMAHFQSAKFFCPDVDFIIDIGGQDMKCMKIRNGVIDSIMLNEACSSGCGSFIQTFAQTLGLTTPEFAEAALSSTKPVDLGTRCTVFMNSKVKQAQKEGASVGDISAGLSYSVVRNALYKVIKIRDTEQLGKNIVVQGGTFLNDAILRCFELVSGRDVIRPNVAGLMGAFGAALIAQKRAKDGSKSNVLGKDELDSFQMDTENTQCQGCTNHCRLTIATFSNGTKFVSGNRCERGEDLALDRAPVKNKEKLPNLFEYKYSRTFKYYKPLKIEEAPRGEIGIPRVLNQYENYPFWFTVLTKLGFRVLISARSSHKIYEGGMETIPSESVCYPAKLAHGHIENLISRGIKTIFYPDVPYENIENQNSNNHYNCPIVCSYPEVIRNNVENLTEKNIKYLNPFMPLDNLDNVALHLTEIFNYLGVSAEEAKAAVEAGAEEYYKYKEDIRQKGVEILKEMEEKGLKGIVLAGRPYHCDPEINHGIPEMINSLGLAVLTEDAVAKPGVLKRPIRVIDQWMYHTRLYEAAAFVITRPDLELVQLTSFGCGLDAVTSDQVQEILESSGKLYTLLKIDEVSNLGAARIRMRSLVVAMNERLELEANGQKSTVMYADSEDAPYTMHRVEFTKEHKKNHTILAPQMAPIQFELVESVFHKHGYKLKLLKQATREDIECGLKYVNNDACFPTIIVIGQMINAILSGEIDPDNTTLAITQTGGGCRATNYVAFLRKALKEAGYPQIPVITISAQRFEKNEGFEYSVSFILDAVKALCAGDMLSTLLLRVRPYEKVEGSANALYSYINRIGRRLFNPKLMNDDLTERYDVVMPNSYFSKSIEQKKEIRDCLLSIGVDLDNVPVITKYKEFVKFAVAKFDALPLADIPRKPRVGLVGEILVKFQPDANNNAIDVIEAEGCEAVLPGVLDFFLYCAYNPIWQAQNLGKSKKTSHIMNMAITFLESLRKPINKEFKKTNGKFMLTERIQELAEKSSSVLSCGNSCGEGWFLTAEMIELIQDGVPNIICAQPFACLPNHVTGKGMIKELRRQYPNSNIVPIDYDPGASEANQLNRIKLMISTAHSVRAQEIEDENKKK
ncbi:CoA-substrate-specific enzyme activase, putative [Ruminococcaceae bacterium YAD3003]|nr:CoA-substrate-specific enzyme activase, putative [Ruminococcaceae bacterium YAD3003]